MSQEHKEEMPFEMCNKRSIIEENRRESLADDLDEDTSELMAMVEKRKNEIETRMSRIEVDLKED